MLMVPVSRTRGVTFGQTITVFLPIVSRGFLALETVQWQNFTIPQQALGEYENSLDIATTEYL